MQSDREILRHHQISHSKLLFAECCEQQSTVDPFFSPTNTWLDAPDAVGHCGPALRDDKAAMIVLIPGAPHTLLDLPQARLALLAWLRDVIGP